MALCNDLPFPRLGNGLILFTYGLILCCGCTQRQQRIEVPDFNPAGAASGAISDLDKNGDEALDKNELTAAPGLLAVFSAIDANQDGKLDSAEIKARLQTYLDDGVGMLGLNCIVLQNGRPLAGATVDFIPEGFLADAITPARAVTRSNGTGVVTQTDGKLPAIAPGLYRVEISKKSGDKELIPARFNTETVLGFEVTQQGGGAPARFDLSSR